MKSKIKTIRKIRQNDIGVICQQVIENMENNPFFPTLPEEHGELKKVLPEYNTSLVDARSRDKVKVSIKNDQKAIVLRLLEAIGDYVTQTCKGDRTMLLSSGFDITDENSSNVTLGIENLEVVLGSSGEATTRIKNATAAIAYVHQYTTEPPGANTVWSSEGTSQSHFRFYGLSSDKRYWFRVVAIGRYGQRAYSPVVSKVIQ